MGNSTADTPGVSETALGEMRVAELREHARSQGITGVDELHKPELLTKVKDHHYAQAHDGAHRPDTPPSLRAGPSQGSDAEAGPAPEQPPSPTPTEQHAARPQASAARAPDMAGGVTTWLPGLSSLRISRPELAFAEASSASARSA